MVGCFNCPGLQLPRPYIIAQGLVQLSASTQPGAGWSDEWAFHSSMHAAAARTGDSSKCRRHQVPTSRLRCFLHCTGSTSTRPSSLCCLLMVSCKPSHHLSVNYAPPLCATALSCHIQVCTTSWQVVVHRMVGRLPILHSLFVPCLRPCLCHV